MGSGCQARGRVVPAEGAWIAEAARLTAAGELVVVPTETVYGVAARAEDAGAMEALYRLKGREPGKRISFLAAGADQVRGRVRWSEAADRLAAAFWPGPLTMVLENGRGDWDGYRVPDHPAALAWLRLLDFPPAVTSANVSGQPPATTAQEASRALGGGVALVLDAGPSPGGTASTVARVYADGTIEVLREGPISGDELRSVVECRLSAVESRQSPGGVKCKRKK